MSSGHQFSRDDRAGLTEGQRIEVEKARARGLDVPAICARYGFPMRSVERIFAAGDALATEGGPVSVPTLPEVIRAKRRNVRRATLLAELEAERLIVASAANTQRRARHTAWKQAWRATKATERAMRGAA